MGRRPSLRCRLVRWLARFVLKPDFRDETALRRRLASRRRRPLFWRRLLLGHPAAETPTKPNGAAFAAVPCPVRHLPPPAGPGPGQAAPGCTLLYLHGGAYVFPPLPAHHWFCSALRTRLGCGVVMPLYPLSPENHGRAALDAAEKAYEAACALGRGPVVIAGDSAGGGLALALAQRLCCGNDGNNGLPRPASLLLICPWLDATLSDPGVPAAERRCHFLQAEGLRVCGRWYSGPGGDPAGPVASPGLAGPLAGLPPTAVWVAAHDILEPDAAAFRRRWEAEAAAAGVAALPPLRYFTPEGGGMHCYPLL